MSLLSWLSQRNKHFLWGPVVLLWSCVSAASEAPAVPVGSRCRFPQNCFFNVLWHRSLLWNSNFSAGTFIIEALLVRHKCLNCCQWWSLDCFRLLLWSDVGMRPAAIFPPLLHSLSFTCQRETVQFLFFPFGKQLVKFFHRIHFNSQIKMF